MDGKVGPWVSKGQGTAVGMLQLEFSLKQGLLFNPLESIKPGSFIGSTHTKLLEAQYLTPANVLRMYVHNTDDTKKVRLLCRGWSLIASDSPFSIHVACGRPMAAVFKSGPRVCL